MHWAANSNFHFHSFLYIFIIHSLLYDWNENELKRKKMYEMKVEFGALVFYK